jgi:signal transduction histidine kinase
MGKPLRVLFVEDSEADAELLLHELARGGYDVTARRVQTADTMRAALHADTWDVVLSDYSMPAFSAPDALAVLRTTDLDLPFIIVSGTIGEGTAVASLKAGACDFLVKGQLARLVPAIERERREVDLRRERALAHRTLEDQLRQAQKMEAVGQLAGGVAHDFNNMLTAILGYAELLTEQIGPDKPIGADLREIRAAAERAAALTKQLLAFSRKQVLALVPLDLSGVIRNLEPMLRRLIGERIRITTALADGLSPVMADATQLEHLVINLSVNARDAMAHGGVLTLATGNVTLDQAFAVTHPGAKAGSYAMLSVADTGIGMPQDVMKRVFEPFYTTKERGHGTGLGLAAVYGTVKQLGGYIGVESLPERGSTFTIYLPTTTRPIDRSAVSLSDAAPRVGTETVLLVEDEAGVRTFVRTVLRRFGYRVLEADSAETALNLVAHVDGPIDLLLTDVVLPGLDGRELALQLTRDRPSLRVLFMSGYASALTTVDGFLLPGAHLLEKPFTAQALLAKTRDLLGTGIEPANR